MRHTVILWMVMVALSGVLVSCQPQTEPLAAPLPQSTVAAIPTVNPTPLTPEATPEVQTQFVVWVPDALIPAEANDSFVALQDLVNTFASTRADIQQVEIRLKRAEGLGGMLETLLAAQSAAPNALPTVAMLRRADVAAAVEANLLSPLDDQIPSAVLSDLYPTILELGRIDNNLYGIAYGILVQHMAYRSVVLGGNFSRFEDVLADQQGFVFPAGGTDVVNEVFLLQYIAAGGTLTELLNGRINLTALRTVLRFYEDAVAQEVVSPVVTGYARSEDYLPALLAGELNAAVVSSTQYLQLAATNQDWRAAPIPLSQGEPLTVVDGWMWVVVARDSDALEAAHAFIAWMLDAARQATFTEQIGTLPSRRAALRSWPDQTYADFVNSLLLNARLPLVAADSNNALRALQNALTMVLLGQRTADEAANDALEFIAS
jgi:ABC-type glycerol-3-phosphate transport system substrate-binding protein